MTEIVRLFALMYDSNTGADHRTQDKQFRFINQSFGDSEMILGVVHLDSSPRSVVLILQGRPRGYTYPSCCGPCRLRQCFRFKNDRFPKIARPFEIVLSTRIIVRKAELDLAREDSSGSKEMVK